VHDLGAGLQAELFLELSRRAAVRMQNLGRALWRNPFRGFVHSARGMEALLGQHGFVRRQRRETLKWSADLYVRADPA